MRGMSFGNVDSHRFRMVWLVLCVALLGGGCAGGRGRGPFGANQRADAPVLVVENRHWSDMTISVYRGTQATRLGQVTTNSNGRFPIPGGVGGPGMSVRFAADPVGSGDVYLSPIVSLMDGDTFVWTLAVNIEHSTLIRR